MIGGRKSVINALSIDVEDWFQVSDFEEKVKRPDWAQYEGRVVQNTARLLALLRHYQVRATFFILTWNVERFPELVQQIDQDGHEIATHGYHHHLIYEQTPDEFRADVVRSLHILQGLTGKKVLGYRAPSFSITRQSLWALDILLDLGLAYDSSIFPIRDPLYGISHSDRFPYVIRDKDGRQLIEFPMSTVQFRRWNLPLGGGAYLRLLPYQFFRWGINQLNRQGRPAIVYLHPWEIDPGQPRLRVRGKRGYSSHYLGLQAMEGKLRSLLEDFRFTPIREVLAL
jgi:polysaccharide deacetylase family protein (PEP-CTERM system associated)